MPHSRLKLGRCLLVAGLLGLALAGCGRKGPLEPPPNATNVVTTADDQIGATPNAAVTANVPTTTEASPFGKPARTNRAITVPERAFVLDPLL